MLFITVSAVLLVHLILNNIWKFTISFFQNSQHLDEINELYEERQTLITSLLHLQSAEVEDVIRKTSRSSSVCSRESLDDLDTASNVRSLITQIKEGEVDKDEYIKVSETP